MTQAVNALGTQTRRPDEIIVWDDGSTDETEAVARELGSAIRYFRAENGGKSRALNAAMAEATGDLIWICDDDDIALPDAAETLAGMLDAAPGTGIAGGSYRRFREDRDGRRREQGPGYWPDLSTGTPMRHLLEDIFLFQNATMVRREIYDRAGPFREDLPRSIDYEMIVRLGLISPIALTDKPLFLQRKHDGDRGPAAARHAASKSDDVWKLADRAIFAEFREQIPLSFYEAMFEAESPEFARRAALLQRGCVHARRTDWPSALEDFEAAADSAPTQPLCEVERLICRRAMGGKHGIEEALARETRRRLAGLGRRGTAGASIAQALVRGLAWRLKVAVRAGRVGPARDILRLSSGLASPRLFASAPGPQTRERRDIPAAAFFQCWNGAAPQGRIAQ